MNSLINVAEKKRVSLIKGDFNRVANCQWGDVANAC